MTAYPPRGSSNWDTPLKTYIDSVAGSGGGGGDVSGKVDKVDTRTSPAAARKVEINYGIQTADPNIEEIRLNGVVQVWINEWGALRGRQPYTTWSDSLLRGVIEPGDYTGTAGCFAELEDRRATGASRKLWGVRWADGATVRKGHVMSDVYVQENASDPIPPEVLSLPNVVVLTVSAGVLG